MVKAPTPTEVESVRLRTGDGIDLHLEIRGPAEGPPLIFAHGFGQSRLSWTESAAALAARGHRCVSPDGRGHGLSGWLSDRDYQLAQFIDDARLITRHVGERPVWVGASMGGLIGMMAQAESTPESLFSALVLVDITPRWEQAGVDRIMQFMRARPEGFASIDDAHAAVREYLPHRVNDKTPERLEKHLVRMDNGRLRWHWDPKLLDTVARESQAWSERLADAARRLRVPVLLISGGRSDVVSEHTVAEFLSYAPHAEHRRIDDATHTLVGDANDAFTSAIAEYLERPGRDARRPAA